MKDTYPNKVGLAPAATAGSGNAPVLIFNELMNLLVKILVRLGLLKRNLDYHLVRASMVIIYFFFGYQKWFPYEAQNLIPFFKNGPLISWMYPVFGVQGASWFLGVSEWWRGRGDRSYKRGERGWRRGYWVESAPSLARPKIC